MTTSQMDRGQAAQQGEGSISDRICRILPCTNLTERIAQLPDPGPSPFAGDPAYDLFFDRFLRALHRSDPRHILLTRDRGVGEQAVLIDLARRCLNGSLEFLKKKRIFTVDCRHIPAEDARAAINGVLGSVSEQEDLVLCLDGFGNLLRGQGTMGTWPIILSHLTRARCTVVGILSPQEYEERLASDADAHDQFSVIPLHEPEGLVAIRLVSHFAAGLQHHYQVEIDPEAIHRTVTLSNSYILHERLPHKAVKVLGSICDDIA